MEKSRQFELRGYSDEVQPRQRRSQACYFIRDLRLFAWGNAMLRSAWIAGLVASLALAVPAAAANGFWFGKVDLVEKTAKRSMRFFVRESGLSLFARGDAKEILLQGFFAKASMSVAYTPIICPNGISGTCGWVTFVSVDQPGNF
jgi:hypothetical protein